MVLTKDIVPVAYEFKSVKYAISQICLADFVKFKVYPKWPSFGADSAAPLYGQSFDANTSKVHIFWTLRKYKITCFDHLGL